MGCGSCDEPTGSDCGCEQEALHISSICNPVECPSNECTESFDAQCVIYTGDDIICNDIIIATSGETIAQMVANITAYFCSTPGNILSAYNSATGVGNTAGISTVNAIAISIPGNTLANDGDEYEMDLYTEYNENDPITLEIGIGAGATWTKILQNAADDKRFFKIKVARIDQNNQLWTISSVIDTFPNIESLEDVDVIYTTKDLSTTENWTVNLINDGSANANAIVLHKAVLYLNKI